MRRTRLILPAAGLLLSGAAALAAAGTAGPQASSPNAGAGSAVAAPSSKPRGGAAATPTKLPELAVVRPGEWLQGGRLKLDPARDLWRAGVFP